MSGRGSNLLRLAVLAVALIIAFLTLTRERSGSPDRPVERRDPPVQAETAPGAPAARTTGAADESSADALFPDPDERREVRATLDRIAAGGPFPYRKDGTVFRNREGRLPRRPSGYYREYTVKTPGEDDRGARRIVQGRDGDTWYTRDHYDSFVEIDPEEVRGGG
jgi:ribonuclease T1